MRPLVSGGWSQLQTAALDTEGTLPLILAAKSPGGRRGPPLVANDALPAARFLLLPYSTGHWIKLGLTSVKRGQTKLAQAPNSSEKVAIFPHKFPTPV